MKKNNYSNMSAIAVNKSLLKEYQTTHGRTVYLDKDSEFQIKLFNPTTDTIAAEVYVNDKVIGVPIIIRPGQLIWLERYLDEARKFKFDTYEVEMGSAEVRAAIANNGDIRIKFYKERPRVTRGFTDWTPISLQNHTFGGSHWNGELRCSTSDLVNTSYSCEKGIAQPISQKLSYSADLNCDTTGVNNTFSLTTSNCNLNVSDTYEKSYEPTLNSKKLFKSAPQTQETGRIEKGGYSSQRFTTVDIELESFPFATESIKLLPKSQKPVFKEDLEKLYCTNCGRKVKPKFKYCPFCGGKLQEIN